MNQNLSSKQAYKATHGRTLYAMSTWTRTLAHTHELQRMGAHAGEWTRAVAVAGFKAKTPSLSWCKQEAFEDDSHDHIIMTRTLCLKSA